MSARQDLDESRTILEQKVTDTPEARFLKMIEAEQGEDAPVVAQPETQPEPDTTNSDEPEEIEEELEAPDEEDSEDPEEDSEDPAETDEDEEESTEALYRVIANGEEKHVTLEELTRGYSRESDYTRQKQELTTQQQETAGERQAIQADRVKYDGMLGQLEDAMKQATPAEPDWAKLRAENPAEFAATYAEWQQHQANLVKVGEERERVRSEQLADYNNQHDEYVRGEQGKLLKDLPDLGDPEKGPKMHQALMDTALAVGYTAEDVAGIEDARAIKVLHYAGLYLKLKESKPRRTKRAKVTRAVAPGARNRKPTRSKARDAEKKLKRTGSIEDAASVFLSDLNAPKKNSRQ